MTDTRKIFQCTKCKKTLSIEQKLTRGCNCLPKGQTCQNCTIYENCLRNRLTHGKQTYCRYSESRFTIKNIAL